jgi:hypothetical protein
MVRRVSLSMTRVHLYPARSKQARSRPAHTIDNWKTELLRRDYLGTVILTGSSALRQSNRFWDDQSIRSREDGFQFHQRSRGLIRRPSFCAWTRIEPGV